MTCWFRLLFLSWFFEIFPQWLKLFKCRWAFSMFVMPMLVIFDGFANIFLYVDKFRRALSVRWGNAFLLKKILAFLIFKILFNTIFDLIDSAHCIDNILPIQKRINMGARINFNSNQRLICLGMLIHFYSVTLNRVLGFLLDFDLRLLFLLLSIWTW